MAEELRGLIEKIQQEGVKAAEDKARTIEQEANERAKTIIRKAEKEAQALAAKAKDEIARMEKSGQDSLKQASRNVLLSLKKEINATLNKLIVSDIRKTLDPSELIKIIAQLIKNRKSSDDGDITVSVRKEDLEKLKSGLLGELGSQAKNGITLKSSEDIRGGFTISYDENKSHYDFTDKAMAEYIAVFINPKLAELLKEEASGGKRSEKK